MIHRPIPLSMVLILVLDVSASLQAFAEDVVDATSLRGKVVCGYQGWFRCPGDAADLGWVHWSRNRRQIMPQSLTFEMWPDMSEYDAEERFPTPGFTYPSQAQSPNGS